MVCFKRAEFWHRTGTILPPKLMLPSTTICDSRALSTKAEQSATKAHIVSIVDGPVLWASTTCKW